MIAFVLGNGISRQNIDVGHLLTVGPVYGCNALYREHTPTVLVATDTPISQTIQRSGYAQAHRFYTRRPLPGLGAHKVPQRYFGYSSGPIAMSIAAADGNREVFLVGFDMGPDQHGKFNNLYADTEFYKKTGSTPTFSGNWARQMAAIAKDYATVRFYRVFGATTAEIPELQDLPNLVKLEMSDFLRRINKPKDQ